MRILFAVLMVMVMLVTVAMATTEYPPIEFRFDGDEDATAVKYSSSFITITEQDGYLHLVGTKGDSDNVNFTLNAEDYFDLYEYPFMKIKYKSTASSAYYQFYILANDASDPTNYTHRFRSERFHTAQTQNEWQANVTPLNGVIATGIGPHGAANSIPTAADDNFVNAFRLDLCRTATAGTTVDLEYIAFFHTEAEANAYGNTCNEYKDAVSEVSFAYDSAEVADKEALIAAVQADVDAIEAGLGLSYDVTTTVSISDDQYAEIAENGFGAFGFDVTFSTYKAVDRTYSYTANVVDTSVKGTVTVTAPSVVERGGDEVVLTAAIDNVIGVQSYKWYESADDVADENDTLIGETTANTTTFYSPEEGSEMYYYAVAVATSGDVTSELVKITYVKPATIIWDMSTQSEVDKWATNAGIVRNDKNEAPVLTDANGISYAHFERNGTTAANYTMSPSPTVSIDNRPYLVERIRRNFTADYYHYFATTYLDSNTHLQYAWYGGMLIPSTNTTYPGDGQWHTVVRHMPTDLNGYTTTLKGTSGNVSGAVEWRSKVRALMIQPSAFTAGTYSDHEFIAFAATEEDAYKVGADYAAKYIAKNADISEVYFANETAVEKLTEVIEKYADIYGYTVSDVAATVTTEPTEGADGKYTFTYKLSANGYTYSYEATATLKGEGTDKPIIWRFNNEDAIADWNKGKNFNAANSSVLKDGVMHTVVAQDAAVSDHYLGATAVGGKMPEELQFYRQLYPYIKVKYRHGGFATGKDIQMYLQSSSYRIDLPKAPTPDVWMTAAFDFSTNKQMNAGTYEDGKMDSLAFWMWNNKTAESYDEIEYIAFFPSGETGKAAWRNFDSKNPSVTGSSDEYIEGYAEIDEVFDAVKEAFDASSPEYYEEITDAASAKAFVEAILDEKAENATYTVSEGEAVDYGFKFTIEVSCGLDYKACFTKYLDIVVKNKPTPIIWRFNNADAVADWNYGRQYNSANSSVVKNNVMYTVVSQGATLSDHYLGAKAVGGSMPEAMKFQREDYPYLKIKYRQGGFMSRGTVYFDDGNTYIALPYTPAANVWTTASYDLSNATLNGSVKSYGTGPIKALGIWFWNNKTAESYDEIEYVAFFPAGDEGKAAWEAFDSENPSETASSDAYIEGYEGVEAVMTALEENFKEQAYPETADLAEAKAIIEETIITAIGDYGTEYTISDGAEAANGYDFVVTLTAGDNYRARQNRVIEVTLMTSGGKQPLIWRFNNNAALADWNYGRQYNADFTPIIKDNVLYDEVGASAAVSDFYLGAKSVGGAMPEALDFNREDYPYIKIKVKQSGFMSQGQIYFGGASNIKHFSAAANTWTTLAYDFSTNKALNTGTYADGNMKSLAFWVRNANGGTGTTEIEYIAFFPKGNAGKRAWEAFDSENPTVTASSDAYLDGYELVAPVEEALKTAFADVNTAITDADAAKAAVEATLTTAIGENSVTYTIADPVASEDGFTVKVTLNAGANPKACVVKEINVEVKNEYPDPIIWNFNNPEFVSQWVGGGGCDVSFGDDDEGSYLRAAMVVPEDNCNITWTIPAEYRFNATEYPYYAIRYKSSRGGNMQFYPATSLSTNSAATGNLYYQFGMPAHTGDWQTKIWNIKTECNAKNNTAGTWDGELQYLRIDFMRSEQVFKWVNIDYIGFFATKEQAEAYVAAPYVEGDKELVDGIIETVDFSSLAELDLDVVDAATASEKLSAFVEALELPEGVTSTQAVFGFDAGDTENADGKVGSYNAKVYFVNGPLTAPAVSSQLISIPLAPKAMIKALGAQIRTPGENQGLRFGASLEKSLFADPDITNISYGTVILPEDVMPEGEKLTLDTVATNPLISVADVKGEVIYSETDAALIYTAVITGISPDDEEACARKFVTRPYVKYTFNGQDYTIYTDAEKTRSVDDVEGLMIEGYDTVVPLGKVGYDRETWMVPFWSGNVVYHELFWPVMPDGAAEDDELEVTLMYPITEVLALKDGTNSVDFAEGKDFYVRDGKLVIPADSAINRTAFNFYIADTADELHDKTISVPDVNSPDYKYNGKKLFYKEGTYIQENFQYSISYLHAETWPETALNPTEDYDETTLTATRAKLANKEDLLIGFFGDSITAGGNNTGNYGTHPLTPKWSQMIVDSLNVLYEYDEEDPGVTLINRAVGGKNTVWGRSGDNNAMPDGFAKNEFKNNIPDLFILAFGMNDESTGVANFKANLINIIDQIRSLNPNCEFLLVSNSMPNPLWGTTANRTQYEDICEEIVTELRARTKEEGGPVVIDCAKLQGMHKELLNIKPYRDMTGNNVNHQNDMLARLYAQTVLSYITDLYK